MKKFLLSLSIFAMTLMAGAQEPVLKPVLKARSIYDVDQDDKVTVQDVPTLVKRLAEQAEDKTAVETQSLLDVLNTLIKQYEKILSELADHRTQIAAIQQQVGLTPGTTQVHEYVDLGLPSGTLWATCNVGAEKPEDFGLFFAWGETVGYAPANSHGMNGPTTDGRKFDWASYKWMDHSFEEGKGCIKYTFADNMTNGCWYSGSTYVGSTIGDKTYKTLTKLEAADDAATANWGPAWRMPTHDQQVELLDPNYTTTERITLDDVEGYKITSKVPGYEGKSIFLPGAGYRYGDMHSNVNIGYYWSSELSSLYTENAWQIYFEPFLIGASSSNDRFYGQSVRAVRCSASK